MQEFVHNKFTSLLGSCKLPCPHQPLLLAVAEVHSERVQAAQGTGCILPQLPAAFLGLKSFRWLNKFLTLALQAVC